MSTPDDMVLNHMDLRSVEVAIPSVRFWDLIGRDLDCCNREVSIEAVKHLERAFWNDCSNVNFESLLVQFGLEVLNVWEPLCEKNENWKFASCPTASDFVLSSLSGATGVKGLESVLSVPVAPSWVRYRCDCKAPYRLLPRDSSFAWVCLSEAGNLNKRICVCPEKGRHNLLFVQNSRCRALF